MINNIYNYYLSTYGSSTFSRHDSHKRSELRDLYNNMVKINKASPIYKLDTSDESTRLAIDIKEAARALSDVLSDISDITNGNSGVGTIATNDNPKLALAEYIGNEVGKHDSFTLNVKQLASSQINVSEFHPGGSRILIPGTYSFDINNNNSSYELVFEVEGGDNNRTIFTKLASLITHSGIGLNANVISDQLSQIALQISSEATGSPIGSPVLFSITENNNKYLSGAVGMLGLNNVKEYPANAVFEINGKESISENNEFEIDDEYKIKLLSTSNIEGIATIKTVNDDTPYIKEFSKLADRYNHLLNLSKSNDTFDLKKLGNSLTGIVHNYSDLLNSNGIAISEDQTLSINHSYLKEEALNGQLLGKFDNLSSFKNALKNKIYSVEVNPMEYISKKIVAYKNPNKLPSTPYSSSAYSGLMFDYTV